MAKWVFHHDGFTEEKKALIHFKDLSFQRGYGIFDFFRLVGNHPLFLNDHLDRFYFSAREMHLPVPLKREALTAAIAELIHKNNLPDTGIRLSLTGGYSDDGFNIGNPVLLISQHSFAPPTEEQVQKGVRLLSYNYQRPLPHIKSIDYQMAVWLQPKRIEAGADDIIYIKDGWISECPRSNFFMITGNDKLVTPAENALAGITRKKVLQLAKKHFDVEERPVAAVELETAKEAFITSTTKQILPVADIDGTVFPQKRITHELLRLFRAACKQE
ncbi:MAG TPA: aminotransferase class IV [Flavisolibacter sp.]|jgi:D-alanine transaminase/branched-chain amino acid aminotransferase|nr:aminotransferase class IV [Flavisolibacter sp.]